MKMFVFVTSNILTRSSELPGFWNNARLELAKKNQAFSWPLLSSSCLRKRISLQFPVIYLFPVRKRWLVKTLCSGVHFKRFIAVEIWGYCPQTICFNQVVLQIFYLVFVWYWNPSNSKINKVSRKLKCITAKQILSRTVIMVSILIAVFVIHCKNVSRCTRLYVLWKVNVQFTKLL